MSGSESTNKSPPAPDSRFQVTAEDLRTYPWEQVIAACASKECRSYGTALAGKSQEYQRKGDKKGQNVFALLTEIASFHPNYESSENPYGSMWIQSNGRRSLNAGDLTEADLATLAEIVAEITDCEFRARVADILWLAKHDFKMVRVAVLAFLESAARLKTADLWPPFVERLERAAQLSAFRGFETLSTTVVAALEGYLAEFTTNDESGLLCDRLMSILQSAGGGDPSGCAKLAEAKARTFASCGNWHFSEIYWEKAASWHSQTKNKVEAKRCTLEAAECNVSRSDAGRKGAESDFGYRAHWMGRGLEALRRAGADSKRIEEVHRKFLELQKNALGEMTQVSIDLDAIPGFRETEGKAKAASIEHVKGYPWERALVRFIHLCPLTDTKAVRTEVVSISKNTLHDKIATTTAIDRTGKTTDILGTSATGELGEEDLRKRMVQHVAQFRWPLVVEWHVEPARMQLRFEHAIGTDSLKILTSDNPFIPPGHEGIYNRGFLAGFAGDWLVAMHLLMPQVEASLRHVFQQHNVITSGLDTDGTQKEKDLNQLLWMPAMEKIFGADIAFDLRGILIERFGLNLRNESAHGLVPEIGFYQPGAVYLWWLLLRLAWIGYRAAHGAQTPESTDASTGNEPT